MPDKLDTAEFRDDYRRHVQEVEEEFNSWPSWKQSVLRKAVSVSNSEPSSEQHRVTKGPLMNNNSLKLSAVKTTTSDLDKRCWAVIALHYVSCDLTHAEGLAEAEDLRRRKQPGIAIVTNDAAYRLLESQPNASTLAA